MLTRLIVEVEPDCAGVLPAPLITAAYHASSSGPVTLVLRGATSGAVDRVLDIVVHGRRDVFGVRYVNASDRTGIIAAARTAQIAIGRSLEFRTLMAESGIECCSPDDSDRVLGPLVVRGVQSGRASLGELRSIERTAPAR